MVGRRLANLLLNHPSFELAMVVGSDRCAGASYGSVWEDKERALREHYGSIWRICPCPDGLRELQIASFEELLRSDCGLVFSSIHARAGRLEDELIREGHRVFSNSPHRRLDSSAVLTVPEIGEVSTNGNRLIKYPNCVTSGLALVLKPLASKYGLQQVVVTTYQSLSGRGDAKYERDLVVGNVYPLHASDENTEVCIRQEIKKLISDSFSMSVTCNRVSVQDGHFVEVRIRTILDVKSTEEVIDILSEFNPLGSANLHSKPQRPIVLVNTPGRPRPTDDSNHHGGMAVAVGNISTSDDVFDIRLSFVVNNLIRGAAGGILLTAELYESRIDS